MINIILAMTNVALMIALIYFIVRAGRELSEIEMMHERSIELLDKTEQYMNDAMVDADELHKRLMNNELTDAHYE